jgi:putative Mg2+ transporter-C (MgtC) family protein
VFDFGFFPDFFTENFIFRVLFAAILGALIGLERDIRGRSAGLRTNILVSVGSSVFMLLSIGLAVKWLESYSGSASADPTRIAAQIITGIGFIGAGAIIKYKFSVQGLTTAACLWTTSAIGMACGAGFFEIAILATVIAIFVLTVLNRVERLYSKDNYRVIKITVHKDVAIHRIIELIKKEGILVLHYDVEKDYEHGTVAITSEVKFQNKDTDDKMAESVIGALEKSEISVMNVHWRHQ